MASRRFSSWIGLFLDVLGHLGRLDLLLQLVDLVALLVLAAQFLLDRLHLLVEVVLLLRLLHLLLDARLDPAVYLQLVDFDFQDAGDAVQALDRRDDLEQVLLLVHAHHQVRGDGVGQLARVVDADRGHHGVVLEVVGQLDVLLEQRHHAAHRRFDVAAGFPLPLQHLDDDAVEALVFLPLHGAGAVDAFDQHLDVAVRQPQALHHVGHAAHGVDVVGARIVHRGVVLGRQEDALVLRQGVLERPRGRRPSNHERHHHVGEYDDVPEGNDGQCLVDFH